jgi:hypothetical protein
VGCTSILETLIFKDPQKGIHFSLSKHHLLVPSFSFLDTMDAFGISFLVYAENAPSCGTHYLFERIRVIFNYKNNKIVKYQLLQCLCQRRIRWNLLKNCYSREVYRHHSCQYISFENILT